VLVLGITTCSAYTFYWFYKTWRDLAAAAEARRPGEQEELAPFADLSPLLRTMVLVLPLALAPFASIDPFLRLLPVIFYAVNIYLILTLTKSIAEMHPDPTSFPRRRPLAAAGLVLALMIACASLSVLKGGWFLLSFFIIVPLAVVQRWLNCYWKASEPAGTLVRQGFNGPEACAIVAGGALLALTVTSFFVLPQ